MTRRRSLAPPAPPWLASVPFAHRGLHGEGVPENSVAAFEAACARGYGVELDVRLSADGVPVVVHDVDLVRVAGVRRRVDQLTAGELAQVRLAGTDQTVPTLADAMARLTSVPVMVELKSDRPRHRGLEPAVAAVTDGHDGPWCVAGFNPWSLRWFRRQRPAAVRVMTAMRPSGYAVPRPWSTRLSRLHQLARVRPAAVAYEIGGLPHPATDAWRAQGGTLLTWTAVGTGGLARGRRLADNVIFEHVLP